MKVCGGLSGPVSTNCAVQSQTVSDYQLRRTKPNRQWLPNVTEKQLVNSFVISRVDYCNSVLMGLPSYQLDRIQFVFNVAALLIYGRGRFDHVKAWEAGNHASRIVEILIYHSSVFKLFLTFRFFLLLYLLVRTYATFIRAPSYQNFHYFSILFDNYLTTLCCLPLLFIIHRPSLSLIVHV